MLRKLCHKRCASFFDTSPLWSKWRPNVAWFPSNMSWKPILPIPPAWSNTIGVKVRTRHVLYFGWYYNRRWHEDMKEESRNPEIYWLRSFQKNTSSPFWSLYFPTPGPRVVLPHLLCKLACFARIIGSSKSPRAWAFTKLLHGAGHWSSLEPCKC